MSTFTVSGPLRYCRCGHGEHEHVEWLFGCTNWDCDCESYKRSRARPAPKPEVTE